MITMLWLGAAFIIGFLAMPQGPDRTGECATLAYLVPAGLRLLGFDKAAGLLARCFARLAPSDGHPLALAAQRYLSSVSVQETMPTGNPLPYVLPAALSRNIR